MLNQRKNNSIPESIAIKAFFFFVLSFFLTSFFVSSISGNNDESAFHAQKGNSNHSIFRSNAAFAGIFFGGAQVPFESEPNPNKSSEIDENENLDEDECHKASTYLSYSNNQVLHAYFASITRVNQTFYKRITISLVILFHSWKDFFSSIA